MNVATLRDMEDRHQDLVSAIDLRDPARIESAARRLQSVVRRLQHDGVSDASPDLDTRVARLRGDILATRMRVNLVADAVANQKRAFERIFGAND
jgi:hypothetical protein